MFYLTCWSDYCESCVVSNLPFESLESCEKHFNLVKCTYPDLEGQVVQVFDDGCDHLVKFFSRTTM